MSVTVTNVPSSGATPNSARNTWNSNDQALAAEINAHEGLTNTAHGGILTYSGQAFKQAVRAATAAVLPTNTLSGGVLSATANGALPSQDGVSLNVGDRLLVKNEGSGTSPKNLIYTVTNLGSASTAWSLTLAPDSTTGNLTSQQRVAISEGTQAAQIWYVATSGMITVGSSSVTWSVPSGGLRYESLTFPFKGILPITNATTTGTLRRPMDIGGTIVSVRATAGGLPVGAGSSQTIDILKNGTTIYATTTNRPSFVPGGSQNLLATLPNTTSCAPGDYYTSNLITAGSPSSGGSDIVVVVRFSF